MKADAVYLRHIIECIRRIEENTAEGRGAFIASPMMQDATLRNFQTLSEATQRLSDDLKGKAADVEWRRISAFRNVLVHDYLGIDLDRIWQIVQNDLPGLKHAVSGLLNTLDGD